MLEITGPHSDEQVLSHVYGIMQLQLQISAERLQQKTGHEILVIIDEVDEEGAISRTMADGPETDGAVCLNGERNVKPGDMLRVKADYAGEYDLRASRV